MALDTAGEEDTTQVSEVRGHQAGTQQDMEEGDPTWGTLTWHWALLRARLEEQWPSTYSHFVPL